MEGWTLSCSCSLRGGEGAVTDQTQSCPGLSDFGREAESRNDPFPWSFLQPAQSGPLGQQAVDGSSLDQKKLSRQALGSLTHVPLWPHPVQDRD